MNEECYDCEVHRSGCCRFCGCGADADADDDVTEEASGFSLDLNAEADAAAMEDVADDDVMEEHELQDDHHLAIISDLQQQLAEEMRFNTLQRIELVDCRRTAPLMLCGLQSCRIFGHKG